MKIPKNLLQKSKEYTICVSSGVDSISACHWLFFNYRLKNIKVLHFNHNLRIQNNIMERKVEDFCSFYGFPLTKFRLKNIPKQDENSLRQQRVEYYLKNEANYINCHHLNDAVESYVANVFTGNPDYTPIRWETEFENGSVIYHPFLKFPKRFFIQYAKENHLMRFVEEDDTNKDLGIRRNHIRHVIVPEMNKWSNLETIVRKKFYERNIKV